VLTDALDAPEPGVVAAAGGSVLDPATRARLAEAGTVVWLRASPQVLAVRVRGAGHRPLLDRDPDGTLARLSEQRAPLYRSVADLEIDVDDAPVDVVVDRILSALTAREAS
jgi:shikimate kinase